MIKLNFFKKNGADTFTKIILLSVAAIVLLGAYLAITIFKLDLQLPSFGNQNRLLLLTNPVQNLTGKIVSINNGKVEFEVELFPSAAVLNRNAAVRSATAAQSAPSDAIKLKYIVLVDDSTQITANTLNIPYSYKTNELLSNASKLSLTNLKPGDNISVSSKEDLRLVGNRFQATSIALNRKSNLTNGTVTSTNKDKIVIKVQTTDQNGSPVIKTLTVLVTPQTEITQFSPGQQKPVQFQDIKTNQIVNVYALDEIRDEDTEITAGKIDINFTPVTSAIVPVQNFNTPLVSPGPAR